MRVFAGVDAGILCITECDSVGISSPTKTYAQQEPEVGRLMASAEGHCFLSVDLQQVDVVMMSVRMVQEGK